MKDYEAIILTAGTCELELVAEFGGLSNRLRLGKLGKPAVDIIAGLANRHEMETDGGFRGIPLFPFANRLDGGKYDYNDQAHQFEQNEKARSNTLHGFLQHIQPAITHDKKSATLLYLYDGSIQGYPFPAEIKMTYTLGNEGSLTIDFKVSNRHNESIPVGIGWHPYFKLDQKVDNLKLQLPPVTRTEVNERMLPTGVQLDFNDFEKLSLIGDTQFDDCLKLISTESARKVKLWSDTLNQGIELWQQTGPNGYNFIQVCTPPDRQSIAIEPVSCGVNAFNTNEGLIHLEPNTSFNTQCGVQLI